MNLDDETLLSAYLDDELDPADRLAVEWSIESNPPLAEQYRSLVLARDAVAGLGRPAIPRDLGPAFGARLAANRRRDRIRKLTRPAGVALAFTGFFGIAASLIFALILLNHSLHVAEEPIPVAVQPQFDPRPHTLEPLVKPTEAKLVAPPSLVAVPQPTEPEVVAIQPPPPGESGEHAARRMITGMLEQPHVRRIRIVTDVLDDPDKIKALIDQDARKNPVFGRISICQEIVIDPDCAEAVEVFAVPMEERDRPAFVRQLARAYPNLVEETEETRPDVVTQLTEVGQVALFRGTEAAPLVEPPQDLHPFIARLDKFLDNHIVEPIRVPAEPGRPRVPAAEVPKKGLVAANPPLDVPPPGVLKPGDRVTVLVWVVTRPTPRL